MDYFKEEDIAERIFFSGNRVWKDIKHEIVGDEGRFGCLKITFWDAKSGDVDDVLLLKVYIKDRAKMEKVAEEAMKNIRQLFQNIILQFSG